MVTKSFLWCMPRLTRALTFEKMSWLKYFHVLHSFHGKPTSGWKKLIPWRTCRNKQSSNSFETHINYILVIKCVLKRRKVPVIRIEKIDNIKYWNISNRIIRLKKNQSRDLQYEFCWKWVSKNNYAIYHLKCEMALKISFLVKQSAERRLK